jgi:hypothetical protein
VRNCSFPASGQDLDGNDHYATRAGLDGLDVPCVGHHRAAWENLLAVPTLTRCLGFRVKSRYGEPLAEKNAQEQTEDEGSKCKEQRGLGNPDASMGPSPASEVSEFLA